MAAIFLEGGDHDVNPWHKIVEPREEVRRGRSFNPDEFAIALEHVVAGTAPKDYKDPKQFLSRTVFTKALTEHAGIALRRLAGQTTNAPPVLTLVTQFGGGKTHTLTTLYHLVENRRKVADDERVKALLKAAGLKDLPEGKVAVFVGSAWDPRDGAETPWIDVARQLAGDAGVAALGKDAKTTPPGTRALGDVFQAANAPVLVLFDEVLNFVNRHRKMADGFYSFIDNLVRTMTGGGRQAAVISLPRSKVEMTDFDREWQERITKVVRRVSRDLLVAEEGETAEVIRRRLFDDLGSPRVRANVANTYADWCFEHRHQLPPEWTAVDSAATEAKAREYLRARFETCYPFHPATLSVFQRKWQTLTQYQQTRGTLAMLAQWVSLAYRASYEMAATEPLITLGTAPLDAKDFRDVVLGQLGEGRLIHAIDTDIAATHSRARALDADTKGPLRNIHRRVAAAILIESSGGMTDKAAHLPELRFAIGGPDVDTTTVDNAAAAVERKGYYVRKAGTDGFRFGFQPTLKKVVSDRRASLDDEEDVKKPMRKLVQDEFKKGAALPIRFFPEDGTSVPDSPKLTVWVLDPDTIWDEGGELRRQLAEWTKKRGEAPRTSPAAIVWCAGKPGRDLRDKIELWQAWRRVKREIDDGTLGGDYEQSDLADLAASLASAADDATDAVWAGYRYIVVSDPGEPDGVRVVDLGAGHAGHGESLCERIVTALKSEGLLNETVGAGHLDRKWPPAFRESGAWPLASLRQSVLNGTIIRLVDPDTVLRAKIAELVSKGDFGLASAQRPDGTFARVWFRELVPPEEVSFEGDVFLLTKKRAGDAKGGKPTEMAPKPEGESKPPSDEEKQPTPGKDEEPKAESVRLRLSGAIPPEVWNRVGRTLIPKLHGAQEVTLGLNISLKLSAEDAKHVEADLKQALADLGLLQSVQIRRE